MEGLGFGLWVSNKVRESDLGVNERLVEGNLGLRGSYEVGSLSLSLRKPIHFTSIPS